MSTAECRGAHEGKGKEEPTQIILRERRKYKEERGHESQFSEDLQTLLFSQLHLAALKKSKLKIKDPKMRRTWPL